MRRITQIFMAAAILGTGAAIPSAPARAQSPAEILQFCLQNPGNRTCRQIERNGGQVSERRGNRERRYERRDERRRDYDRRDRRRDYDRRDDRRWDDRRGDDWDDRW